MRRGNATSSFGHLSSLCPLLAIPGWKLRVWTQSEISVLRKFWRSMTDRELSTFLDRTLEAVRSRRQDLLGPRWTSPSKRWEGKPGIVFEKDLIREYLNGSSQSLIAKKFHIEWGKLRQVLVSHGISIRGNRSKCSWISTEGLLRSGLDSAAPNSTSFSLCLVTVFGPRARRNKELT